MVRIASDPNLKKKNIIIIVMVANQKIILLLALGTLILIDFFISL